ncbi:alternate-type signal peptide domain-containing protein [Cellulomonas dongxiuzhuiae]|uniref:alternate-type signal peptide domain-containing protein n=1 Tax=Cellulomonas dongxiuzhuiae TaxID=2819979 RepID=UPI001AAF1E82|nr:alternate-type signal peptide domain-containing protein [Cellulomonas dongxiuzhuiae]MBO3088481.1 alternate-type signal peptide domain-containing protein [Cellulomonas dongxiuzhuiae]
MLPAPIRASSQKGITMQNKTKGLIAGVAGIALLTGGSTFALWSASDSIDGGEIINGNLAVTAEESLTWVDASEDRTGGNHPIDLTTWRMVPGDIARGTQTITVELTGDNLVADLGLSYVVPQGGIATDVTATYTLFDGSEEIATGIYGEGKTVRFAANDDGQGSTADTTSPDVAVVVDADGTKTLTVVVDVAFDRNATGSMKGSSVLQNMAVTLGQVREGAAFVTPAA